MLSELPPSMTGVFWHGVVVHPKAFYTGSNKVLRGFFSLLAGLLFTKGLPTGCGEERCNVSRRPCALPHANAGAPTPVFTTTPGSGKPPMIIVIYLLFITGPNERLGRAVGRACSLAIGPPISYVLPAAPLWIL